MKISYQVQFVDGTTFIGNGLKDDWRTVPEKPIQRLVVNFNGKNIVLQKFKSYNYLIEKINCNGKIMITKILIIGKEKTFSKVVTLDFLKRKSSSKETPFGKEHDQFLILKWWKPGIN